MGYKMETTTYCFGFRVGGSGDFVIWADSGIIGVVVWLLGAVAYLPSPLTLEVGLLPLDSGLQAWPFRFRCLLSYYFGLLI